MAQGASGGIRYVAAAAMLLSLAGTLTAGDAQTRATESPKLVIAAPGRELTFESTKLLQRKDIETLTIQDESAYPRQKKTFRAVKMASLLKDVKAPDDSTVEFIAVDGFTSSIPMGQLRQTSAKTSIAYLAIEDPANKWPAQRFDENSAGPFYLIWLNPRLSNISREWWPYRIDRVRVRGRIEELYPEIVPSKALPRDAAAVKGYRAFVNNCLPCHTLNESGPSKIAPDLNVPMSPTEYFRAGILRKFIRNPQNVRKHPTTSMGPFPEVILSEEELDQLIAYLEHMAAVRGKTTATETPRAQVERLVLDSLHSWETGDVDVFRSTMHEDVTFAYPGKRTDGAGALDVFKMWRKSYENTRVHVHQLLVDGNRFAAEYQFATTRKDTGKRSVVGTVATGLVKDGKLYVVKEYLDGRVSRQQEAGELPLDEGAEPFPWPLESKQKSGGATASTPQNAKPPPFPPVPESISGARTLTYKTQEGLTLPLFLFSPAEQPGSRRDASPAILFFHGSGWESGTVLQFAEYARLLSTHGMAAAVVEYRVKEGYGGTPFDGVADARSAIRWLRGNADQFGIDPQRIAAAGASAGAHVALAAAIFKGKFDDPTDDLAVSARPDALVLFAPVTDTTATGYASGVPLFGGRERELSPVHHLAKGLPPILMFQGTEDPWVPYAMVRHFESRCRALGNSCELVSFAGRNHHFYNHARYFELRPHLGGPHAASDFDLIIYLLERFLHEHGILDAPPRVPA